MGSLVNTKEPGAGKHRDRFPATGSCGYLAVRVGLDGGVRRLGLVASKGRQGHRTYGSVLFGPALVDTYHLYRLHDIRFSVSLQSYLAHIGLVLHN